MRDAFGGVFTMKLLLVFLFIYVSFTAVSYNYAKAFRVKNTLIDFIEKNQVTDLGNFFNNQDNVATLKNKLASAGYSVECSRSTDSGAFTTSYTGKAVAYSLCGISVTEKEISESNKQIHYEIVTKAYWNLGSLNKLLVLAGKSENSESAITGSWNIKGEAVVTANANAIMVLTPTLVEVSRESNINTKKIKVTYKAKFNNNGITLNSPSVKVYDATNNADVTNTLTISNPVLNGTSVSFSIYYPSENSGSYTVKFAENSVKLEREGITYYSSEATLDTRIIGLIVDTIEGRSASQYQCNSKSTGLTNGETLISISSIYNLSFNNNVDLKTSDIKVLSCSSYVAPGADKAEVSEKCKTGNEQVKIIKYSTNDLSKNAFNIVVTYDKKYVDYNNKDYQIKNPITNTDVTFLTSSFVNNYLLTNSYYNYRNASNNNVNLIDSIINYKLDKVVKLTSGTVINRLNEEQKEYLLTHNKNNEELRKYIKEKNIIDTSKYITDEDSIRAKYPSLSNEDVTKYKRNQEILCNNELNNAIATIQQYKKTTFYQKIYNLDKTDKLNIITNNLSNSEIKDLIGEKLLDLNNYDNTGDFNKDANDMISYIEEYKKMIIDEIRAINSYNATVDKQIIADNFVIMLGDEVLASEKTSELNWKQCKTYSQMYQFNS